MNICSNVKYKGKKFWKKNVSRNSQNEYSRDILICIFKLSPLTSGHLKIHSST